VFVFACRFRSLSVETARRLNAFLFIRLPVAAWIFPLRVKVDIVPCGIELADRTAHGTGSGRLAPLSLFRFALYPPL